MSQLNKESGLMLRKHHLKYTLLAFLLCSVFFTLPVFAQTDIQPTVQAFLQAWYVDRKPPAELKSYIAKDNGFNLQPPASSNAPRTEARTDPVQQLFEGAFAKVPIGAEVVRPKSLSDAIEYPLAKQPATSRAQTQPTCATSEQFAICKPDQLPKGSVQPAAQPTGNDPVANYLWHLSKTYKNNLYIVLYTTKGPGLLKETAILYWIPEGGSWKLAAFKGTNW